MVRRIESETMLNKMLRKLKPREYIPQSGVSRIDPSTSKSPLGHTVLSLNIFTFRPNQHRVTVDIHRDCNLTLENLRRNDIDFGII